MYAVRGAHCSKYVLIIVALKLQLYYQIAKSTHYSPICINENLSNDFANPLLGLMKLSDGLRKSSTLYT